jgi:protein phosphatase
MGKSLGAPSGLAQGERLSVDKIAIISDIHGNMPALEAVLADIRARGIDLIYNLGDLVGKGARSDLVIDRCREVCQVIVRGNWDDHLLRQTTDVGAIWYRQQLGDERLAYLAALPYVHDFWLSGKRVRLFHASQESVYTRVYSSHSYETHLAMFQNTPLTGFDQPEPDIVGYADIHTPYLLPLYYDHKTLFNDGSVGNPLDLPLACYVIMTGTLDSRRVSAFSIDFVRLPYDIEREIEEARDVGVPDVDAYAVELRTAVYRGRQKQLAR